MGLRVHEFLNLLELQIPLVVGGDVRDGDCFTLHVIIEFGVRDAGVL